MSETAVSVRGVSKQYRLGEYVAHGRLTEALTSKFARGRVRKSEQTLWALRDVSFDVQAGGVLGIIGGNGAGKSTLLKILSRITEPTSGRIEFRGRVGALLEVGSGFHVELTGRENVYLNGAILGMGRKEIQRKFDEIVEFAEVERFLDTPVKRYSSGMHVRLAFAVAAHLEPEILVVDEVLAVGDIAFQEKCLAKMGSITSAGGRTVLFVSHNLSMVESICERVILIEAGRVVSDGHPAATIREYQDHVSRRRQAHVDLEAVSNRYGQRAKAKLVSLTIFDAKGNPSVALPFLGPLSLRARVRFSEPCRAPEVGFAISTVAGQRVSHLVSTWEWDPKPVEAGEYEFTATIESVPYVPGIYTITVWVKDQGRTTTDDGIEAAGAFEITPAPVEGRHINFDDYCRPGEVYLPSNWTLEKVSRN